MGGWGGGYKGTPHMGFAESVVTTQVVCYDLHSLYILDGL